jgi:hypothetical protein
MVKREDKWLKFYYTDESDFPLIVRALKFFLRKKKFRKGSMTRHALEHIIEDFERE